MLRCGKNRGSCLQFIHERCGAFLVRIWLNDLGQLICFRCNLDNIKLLSSRWAGRTGSGRPLGERNVLFCHVWYAASFWFLLHQDLIFWLLFLQPLCVGKITGALKIAYWTNRNCKTPQWHGDLAIKIFPGPDDSLWLTSFRSAHLILALF